MSHKDLMGRNKALNIRCVVETVSHLILRENSSTQRKSCIHILISNGIEWKTKPTFLKLPQSNKINFLVKWGKWGGGLKMLNKQVKDKTKYFILNLKFMATKIYRGEYVLIDMAHCYKTFW